MDRHSSSLSTKTDSSMLHDLRKGHPTSLKADVCVVGAGPCGIALASRLADLGAHVVLLDAGPREPDDESQRLAEGEVSGYSYSRLDHARARALGGTAHFWNIDLGGGSPGLRLRRMDESDFRVRPWLPNSGWPFDISELDQHYERAERIFGIPSNEPPNAEDPVADRLDTSSSLKSTAFWMGRVAPLFDHAEKLIEHDSVDVVLGATVAGIRQSTSGEVDRIEAISLTGGHLVVEASSFVLATGGIENARLLLLTNPEDQGQAIGNGYDLVGRNFMEHFHTRAGFLDPSGFAPSKNTDGLHQMSGSLAELWFRYTSDRMAELEVPNIAFALRPTSLSEMRRAQASRSSDGTRAYLIHRRRRRKGLTSDGGEVIRRMARDIPGVTKSLLATTRWFVGERVGRDRELGTVLRIDAVAEQLPHLESRVTLSSQRDAIGQPQAKLNWEFPQSEMKRIWEGFAAFGEELETRGVGRFLPNRNQKHILMSGGYHHMGTTRMSTDPETGVCDPNGRVHACSNLYAAGSSLFPTSGVSNPTLTAMALSLRLADHLGGQATTDPS